MSAPYVDATARHAQAAEDRTRNARRLQDATLLPPMFAPAQSNWLKRWFRWENLTVAGRVIEKGWVVPQPLGIALLVVILGGVGGLYWRLIDKQQEQDRTFSSTIQKQNEMLIRIDQRLIDKTAHDAEEHRKAREDNELQDMKIQDVKEKLLVLNTKRGK